MLQRMSKYDRSEVLALLVNDDYALFARSVTEGRAAGRVYVDKAHHPMVAAIVSAEEERCYLTLRSAGLAIPDWQHTIRETLARDQYEINGAGIEYFLTPEADETVHAIFHGLSALWNPAFLYHAQADCLPELPLAIPGGYVLQPITNDWLSGQGIKNKALITDEWDERTDNVDGVRGFCLLHKQKVVTVCHIDFRHQSAVEIGIITDEKSRRKGLAVAVVANTIDFFRQHGITQFIWHAPQNNPGSCRVAEKSGLRIQREFGEYWLHYRPGNQSLMLGYAALRAGNTNQAVLYYEKALELEAHEKKPFGGQFSRQQVSAWIKELRATSLTNNE